MHYCNTLYSILLTLLTSCIFILSADTNINLLFCIRIIYSSTTWENSERGKEWCRREGLLVFCSWAVWCNILENIGASNVQRAWKMTRQCQAIVPVVRRANSVINQPVLCQGSCTAMFKAVWPAWSRQAYAIHSWAVSAITRTILKQCLPCTALGFKSGRVQRRKYMGEGNEALLSFRSCASPVIIFTRHYQEEYGKLLARWVLPVPFV